jgi:2-polyprenyl-3-methyl-5-hydroxy-6-metoxy-1,4-benzoquinol methylase
MFDSDKHWRQLGRIDPYLRTVRTLDPYKLDSNSPPVEGERYFASGERYVSHLFDAIERHVTPGFRPTTAVDFGCSVGRLAIPLARRCQSVIGLDVSKDALVEAEANAARQSVTNVRWLTSDDDLSSVTEPVELFHSYNVLQHLSVARGMSIVRRALQLLARGGVIAVHVPYADRASRLRRAINWAQVHIPGVNLLANIARGRSYDYPQMLMNAYDLGTLLDLVRERGCTAVHCMLVDQERYPGAVVIARLT